MARKRSRTKKSKSKWTIDQRWRAIAALFIAMMSIFLLIALTSYIYTWKDDQDKVIEFSWELLLARDVQVQNWLGRFGAIISFIIFYKGIGITSFLLPVFGFGVAIIVFFKRHWMQFIRLATYLSIAILIFPLTFEFLLHASPFAWGGAWGYALFQYLSALIGMVGLGVLVLCLFTGLIYWHNEYLPQIHNTFRFTWKVWRKKQKQMVDTFLSGEAMQSQDSKSTTSTDLQPVDEEFSEVHNEEKPALALEEAIELDTSGINLSDTRSEGEQPEKNQAAGHGIQLEMDENSFLPDYQDAQTQPQTREAVVEDDQRLVVEREDEMQLLEPYDPTKELSNYSNPVLDLLDNYMTDSVHINRKELESNKDQIITTLLNYKIEITKIRATIGPTVTLYEIVPAPGVRISRIKNLEDDIALSLAALGIRIIAPIPGKGTIGIEVPNKKKQIVSLKETLASDKFNDAKMELPIGLGKTISNEVFVADLAKMPHLLIAGATGQGKSVGINTLIMSLLYRKHPSQVKLVLIDPKKVELFPYSKLEKHFLAFMPDQEEPIITDTRKVVHTLNSLCMEMDDRYNLLKKAHARNIKEYNKKFVDRKLNPLNGHKYLPFIVLVI
ncbi:MAG TPA: DNA translocase FtsK 4TM domain-containing protein, partial [Membranihabitans sp.]|nr:DNA translocase FtsK 4TM domain-containing protein [Membranihabitans sp.]